MITPSHKHINVEGLFKVGKVPNITVGFPTIQGATVAGTHGIGVKTPSAAAVAAITAGFVGEEHIPNVIIFAKGLLSMIEAAGLLDTIVLAIGRTIIEDGATPKVHFNKAPITTCGGIKIFSNVNNCIFKCGFTANVIYAYRRISTTKLNALRLKVQFIHTLIKYEINLFLY